MKKEKDDRDKLKKLRERAEQSVGTKIEEISQERVSQDEVQHLIHELQVYQAELELQNDELRRAQEETQEAHDRYAALYDFAPVGYFTLDSKGVIRQVNLSGASLLGLERAHLVGKPFILFLTQESRIPFYRHFKRVFESGTPQTSEIELKRPDGVRFHLRLESSLSRIPPDEPPECQSVLSDITDRVNAEEEIRALNRDLQTRVDERTAELQLANERLEDVIRELEAKNEELETFSHTVSHDLNAPLITVQSFVSAIMKDLADGHTEQPIKDLERVHSAAKSMSALLHGLRKLSQVGRTLNSLKPTPFKKVVEEALGSLRGFIQQTGAQVTVAEELPVVFIDKLRMVQVLQNLVENAIKFSRAEEPPVIEIGSFEKGWEQLFYVKDHGGGIDPHNREHVFDLFSRLDPSVEGIGLGLALVKKIVEHHNGRVWIRANEGEPGTTVLFSLPRKRLK